ncbi:ABC transporter permease [Kibdelosporangium phytohabitans]|uniref:ABC transporter permease n=1 Tax=Kibdelosporangium phytohabitans TaxID=860235 RepID=A0A0N9HNG5_9PSEU|nr:ABC transporter permease [Kibdelosporangium phytohabitans]ALG05724.1 ABC transporter permease [Kibdelosporangium phytohabitans]MBE1466286.1 ABC-2 type transport system permease protein [Kibdelosporangium phytohabitans]
MSTLVGTGSLIRLALRLDRVRLPVWILVTVGLVLATATSVADLYPDEASRRQVAATIGSNPAMTAIYGTVYDTSIGAVVMWRLAITGALLITLMSIMTVNRHTRQDEEAGRLELIGATVVGRHAPMAAALIVTTGANVLVALLIALGLDGQGLPVDGSLLAGFAFGTLGIAFAAVAAVAAQLAENTRTVTGIATLVLAVAFVLRLIGDAGSATWLSWLSPIGWVQQAHPYAENRWWILALLLAVAVVLVGVAFGLVSRRDHGAGLIRPRPGPPEASASLSGPFGLAWRLHRWSMTGWLVGFLLLGTMFGAIANSATELVEDNPQVAKIVEQMGGKSALVDAFMTAILGIIALVASIYAVQATLRLRTEETSVRAEPVLATGVSRWRWALSHLVFAAIGATAMLIAAGVAMGLAYGISVGDISGQFGNVMQAALVQLPATLVVAGIAMALFGLAPRYVIGSWAALTVFWLLGQLGPMLRVPQWLMNVSPFTHVPKLLNDISATPLVWLSVVAAVLMAAGLAGFRRRDIG